MSTLSPATNSTVTVDARERAARGWFGYGRWDAPYWFVGMEPGGNDDIAWYDAWVRLGEAELSDCRAHHLGTNFPNWHGGSRPPTQPTWRRLIQLLLGYEGKPADLDSVSTYQRDKWGSLNGDAAVAEVSAIRARNISAVVDRTTHADHRISILQKRLLESRPPFAVFYGRKYKDIYERIAQAQFDAEGNAWHGPTLCVLVAHPAGQKNPLEMKSGNWWISKGRTMRTIIDHRKQDHNRTTESVSSYSRNFVSEPAWRYSLLAARPKNTIMSSEPAKEDVIRVLVLDNPKLISSKSYRRYECYRDGMTFAEYEATVSERLGDAEMRKCKADVKWDSDRNFIRLVRNGQPVDLNIPVWLRRP